MRLNLMSPEVKLLNCPIFTLNMMYMSSDCLTFRETNRFSKLICDYTESHPDLMPYFNRPFHFESFLPQMTEKSLNYYPSNRQVLVDVLKQQYENISITSATSDNIDALLSDNTFTVTTGHQLNLFTGPLYFWYKIIDTIKLAHHLSSQHPVNKTIPLFWMATEDHDFEEISHFNVTKGRIQWDGINKGSVGRRSLKGLSDLIDVLSKNLENGPHRDDLFTLFENAYSDHSKLSDATRFLVNELFGEDGLVILDADHPNLKRLFVPFLKDELLHQTAFDAIEETSAKLATHYHKQVNPRRINLFYLTQDSRVRIERQGQVYVTTCGQYRWSENEMIEHLESHPEHFSPNALLRPLYQEVILPNICYVGGGAELAYWLQLKTYFESQSITFPILKVRNSALLVTEKQWLKWNKFGLMLADYLLPLDDLTKRLIVQFDETRPNFENLYDQLDAQFSVLKDHAKSTDPSFTSAVEAQMAKQTKGLQNLEKRWRRAQKKTHAKVLERLKDNFLQVNPEGHLQERYLNFCQFYVDLGPKLKNHLFSRIDPMYQRFYILKL